MNTVQIVEFHTSGVKAEYDIFGGVDIKIDDFVYVHINYDYRYTSNAERANLANHILAYLGGEKEPSKWVSPIFTAQPVNKSPDDSDALQI